MYQVIKRDGKVVDFDLNKIKHAIISAFNACQKQFHPDTIDFLVLKVTADFESKIKEEKISVEAIQDSVESVLIKAGYDDIAKAYILYRKQREKLRNIGATMLDYKQIVDNYLKINDWRVKENSTVTYSVGGLILSNSGAITANYWLSEVYDEEIAEAQPAAADVDAEDETPADEKTSEEFWAQDESQLKLDPPPAPAAEDEAAAPDYAAFKGVKFSE